MMPIRFLDHAVAFALALALAACAAAAPGYEPETSRNKHRLAQAPLTGGMRPDGTYALSEEEGKFDCKKLTGAVQIKILQLRHFASRPVPSAAARTMTGAAESVGRKVDTAILGKKAEPSATDLDYAGEKARLVAFNNALMAKGCRYFDVEAELKPERGATVPALLPAKK